MVLAELGGKINAAFSQLSKSSTIDDEAINTLISEICNALLMADVNVNIVKEFRDQVKLKASLDESQASGKYDFFFFFFFFFNNLILVRQQ